MVFLPYHVSSEQYVVSLARICRKAERRWSQKANESQNDGFREGHLRPFYFATLTVLLHDRSLLDISIFRTAELW